MMIGLAVLCMVLSLVSSIWALVIIFKRSVVGGLLSLFLGLPMLYFLVTGWGKEGRDIKKPFFMSLVLWGAAAGIMFSMLGSAAADMQRQMQEQMKGQMSAPAARPSPGFGDPAPIPSQPPAATNVRVSNPAAPQPAAEPRPVPIPIPAVVPPVAAPQPMAAPPEPKLPPQRAEAPRPVKEAPLPKAQAPCVYKPVMTDEDLAKCR